MVRPELFLTLKIFKSTMEFIRLEGEIENKSRIHSIILKLDGKTIKLSGFSEILKVSTNIWKYVCICAWKIQLLKENKPLNI